MNPVPVPGVPASRGSGMLAQVGALPWIETCAFVSNLGRDLELRTPYEALDERGEPHHGDSHLRAHPQHEARHSVVCEAPGKVRKAGRTQDRSRASAPRRTHDEAQPGGICAVVGLHLRWAPVLFGADLWPVEFDADGSLDARDAGGGMGVPDDGVEDAHERPLDVLLGELGLDLAQYIKVATSLLADRGSEPLPVREPLVWG